MPLLWVVGDSWSDPGYAGDCRWGWPWLVGRRLGWGVRNSAQGGAGYVTVNGAGWTFPVQVARFAGPADVVVVVGSVNDLGCDPAAVGEAAADCYRVIGVATGAPLLVVGPQSAGPPPVELGLLRDAVAGAAAQVGAVFCDALEWTAGRPELIDPASHHPSPAGQAFLADTLAPVLGGMLTGAPPGPDGVGGFGAPLRFPLQADPLP